MPRLQRRRQLLVEHDLPRPQRAVEEAERLRCARGSSGGTARIDPLPGPDRARRCGVRRARERRRRGRRRLLDARLARDGGRDALTARPCEPTGPCQSSGTLRTALAVIVRSELPTNSSIAPSRPTAAASTSTRARACPRRADQPGDGEPARDCSSRCSSRNDRAVEQLDRAVEARGDVGVVGRDDEREAELVPAARRSGRARARRCPSRDGRSARRRAAAPGAARARARSRPAAPRRPRARPAARPASPARPTSSSSSSAPSSALGRRRRRACGERDVLERGEVRQQVRALEHVARSPRARDGAARCRVQRRRAARPATRRYLQLGSTSPPSTCSSVVFPEPERPQKRTALARRDLEIDLDERVHAALPLP